MVSETSIGRREGKRGKKEKLGGMTKKEKSAEKGKGNEKGKKEIEAQNLPFSYVIYFPHDFLIGYPFFWLFTVSFYLE